MRVVSAFALALGVAACAQLKAAPETGDGGPSDLVEPEGPPTDPGPVTPPEKDGGHEAGPQAPKLIELPISNDASIAGSLSVAVDAKGDVVVAWLDTPSAQRHLHLARIAGAEDPPRLAVISDRAIESTVPSLGQAVSVVTPAEGCFLVLWGQRDGIRVASVGPDATPGPSSMLVTLSSDAPIARLSQIRTVPKDDTSVLVAWSEVARFGVDAAGVYRSGTLPVTSCTAGAPTLHADRLSTADLPYEPPPAGAPELAIARVGGTVHSVIQQPTSDVLGLFHRSRSSSWTPPSMVDAALKGPAGGSVGLAAEGTGLVSAYYARTSDTRADLVVKRISAKGAADAGTVLEGGLLTGMAAATSLEAPRVAIAASPSGPVIAAAFARDESTSEVRVYRSDKNAPGGFRSELLATGVFGPKGGADGHPLVDVAVDDSGRIHVAWRSGTSKSITYARLLP